MFKAASGETCPPLEYLADRLALKPGQRARQQRSRSMLLRALDGGTTIAFLGAGISQPFGYPTWSGLGHDVFQCTLNKLYGLKKDDSVKNCIEYIEDLRDAAAGNDLPADSLMFMIGACKEALVQHKLEKDYYQLFCTRFGGAPYPLSDNAFKALLDLPIKRFVTTNYDCEIENALARIRKGEVTREAFGLEKQLSGNSKGRLSFTQRPDNLERIALLGLAMARGNENMVFHCHGRFDDPHSIVASEADYQQWYLSQEDVGPVSFQYSIPLLLGSNPLLFIGYSLQDQDLLRPLRQLGVLDPQRKYVRPIFALFEESKEHPEKDLYYGEALCERFGVHVILYPPDSGTNRARALRRALENIKSDLEVARQKWSEKPLLKGPGQLVELPEAYCEIACPAPVPVKSLAELEEEVRTPGVVVLDGPSGSGKSFHAIKLMKSEGFCGRFYWNAHYGNEAVTAIDYALAYFDPQRKCGGSRFERICQCLRENRYLFVLDGCERLLQKSGEDPQSGTTYSVTFRRLLKAFADPKNRSTVVLATRLWPADLDLLRQEKDGRSIIRRLSVTRPGAREVEKKEPFAALLEKADQRERAKREISALCSLLRGHSYGLFLAGIYINHPESVENSLKALEELNRKLASRHRDERLQEMVRLQMVSVDQEHGEGSAYAFLERLSSFLGPVCEETLAVCSTNACLGSDPDGRLRKSLINSGLLFCMHQPAADKGNRNEDLNTYALHSTARGAVLRTQHGAPTDPLPAFGLSGCTCGRAGVDPERTRKRQIQSLFDHVIAKAEEHHAKGDCERASSLCRDAFTLVRTRMQANTAPRWCTCEEYLQFPLNVAVLAQRVAPDFWTYCEHADGYDLTQNSDAPLFPAELAWLYNDIALALSAGGSIHDACKFWERAYEVCRLIEDPKLGGGFHLEVLLSLAFTFIEMGKLPAGSRQLDDAERLLCRLEDDDYTARILGLRGLMRHLQGDLQEADELYDRCLKLLRPGVNLRAQSIFLKHKADIKISTQEFEEADLLIRNSRAFAESGVFPDLVANARISEGHRLTRAGQAVKARLEYTAVLRESQRIGLRKLEVRALTALARLALDQKDAENGRDLAMKALSLANELGLGLRQSHALVVLGLATLELGQSNLGIAYLKQAKRLADSQEYWSRSREAENKLMELGVKFASED